MSKAKDFEEARQWCEEARKILRRKRFGESERSLFDKAVSSIGKLLPKLDGSLAYDDCLEEYFEIVGKAHDAEVQKDSEEVIEASNELAELVKKCEKLLPLYVEWVKALEKFEERLIGKLESVELGFGLRDAYVTGSEVRKHLDLARKCCDDAELNCDLAKKTEDLKELKTADGHLNGVAGHLKSAEEAAKRAKETSKELLEVMAKFTEDLRLAKLALQEIRGLPGAETKVNQLSDLIDQTSKIPKQNTDGLWTGHAEASQKLAAYPKIVEEARKASKTFLEKDVPEDVMDAYLAITHGELGKLYAIAPSEVADFYQQEANRGLNLGRSDAKGAVLALQKLGADLKEEVKQQTAAKKTAENELKSFREHLEGLEKKGVPPLIYADAMRVGRMAESGDFRDRQWVRASTRLGSANVGLKKLSDAFAKDGTTWQKNLQELQKIKQDAGNMVQLPLLASDANRLREAADELLSQFANFDLAENIKAFADTKIGTPPQSLPEFYKALSKRAKEANFPTDKKELDSFVKALNEAQSRLSSSLEKLRTRLKKEVGRITVDDPRDLELLHQHYQGLADQIWEKWLDFRAVAKCDEKEVASTESDLVEELVGIEVDEDETDELLSKLRKAAAPRLAEALRQEIQAALDECQRLGVKVDDLVLKLDKTRNSEIDELLELEKKVLEKRNAARSEQYEECSQQKSSIKKLVSKKELKKLSTGKEFKEGLQLDGRDIHSLLDLADPYAIELAEKRTKELEGRIQSVLDHPKVYEQNKELTKAISKRIGELPDKLPETHSRLKKRLIDAIALSKSTDPQAMTQVFKDLEVDVTKAEQDLVERKKELKEFDKKYEELEASYAKLKEVTKTRVTEKADAFDSYFTARLAEASGLKSKEAPVGPAIKAILDLQKEIDGLLNSEDPRLELRKRDGEEAHNQRLVRDLARQFQTELTIFRTQTYQRAKEAVRAAPDGDIGMVKGLGAVANSAESLVSPYLKLVQSGPSVGKQEAPRVDKVKADFQRARGMLEQAQKSLERLMASPTTTNVSVDDDRIRGIQRVRSKWEAASRQYSATLRAMAEIVRKKGKEDTALQKDFESAADVIHNLSSHFRPTAFSDSLKILEQPLPKEKAERSKVAKQLLAGREEALRVMRQYRTDLTKHPILVKLTDRRSNPFMAAEAMAAAAALRTSLKEIELQSLISVEK